MEGTAPNRHRRGDRHLVGEARAVLVGLIRSRPGLSGLQIARLYRERTGDSVTRQSVNRVRRSLRAPGPGGGQLDGRQAAALEWLCREAADDGPVSPSGVARQFEAAEGRRISTTAVRRRVLKMGLEIARVGCPPGRSRIGGRMDRERERHAAGLPVDRSPRIGRSGKVSA